MTTLLSPLAARRRGYRRGFTLVELLVVIAIIGTLTALGLAGVQMAREAARRATCVQNMKQTALAMLNYESAKQRFPGYVQSLKRSLQPGQNQSDQQYLAIQINGLSGSQFTSTTDPDDSRISWAAIILQQMEEGPVYDAMLDSTVTTGNARALIRPIAGYVCPDDTEVAAGADNAGLSYSANAGAWDWYTSGGSGYSTTFNRAAFGAILGDTRANGIFHNLTFGKVKIDAGDVSKGDGLSNTLLLAESIQKEIESPPAGVGLYTWAGVGPNSPGEQQLGVVWLDPQQYGGAVADSDWSPFTTGAMVPFSAEGSTPSYDPASPQFARPSSGHAGVFNAAMADGSVRTIATSIDYDVYQRLLTVQGRKCVEPVTQAPSAYQNLPPLAEGDF